MHRQFLKSIKLIFLLALGISVFGMILLNDQSPNVSAAKRDTASIQKLYLPLIQNNIPTGTRRIYAPNLDNTVWFGGAAIFWFGRITPSENYVEVRIEYTDTDLYVRMTIFDRRIWCNTNPQATDPTVWDALALSIDTNGNGANTPGASAYRFISQFTAGPNCVNGTWSPAYRGNGTSWVPTNVTYSIDNFYRGDGGPNQDADNQGWVMTFTIPFASLGMSGAPSPGTLWRLGVTLYDRDDAIGTPIPAKVWPETFSADRTNSWGQLSFGLPSTYVAPPATPRSTVTIKNGLNGAVVTDGEVGGSTVCGQGLDVWTQWGDQNYAGQQQVNIQNQEDVADWPCFSKYYISFPLNSVPSGKVIISSTLTLYQFGNAGQKSNPGPFPSLIQAYTVNEDWTAGTLSWNNAPLAGEYISETTVNPLDTLPPWPGIPRTWDVSSAVAAAYAARHPLRLVLYSADLPMHSGKYFYSSNADSEGRPTLQILWGDP